MANEPKIKTVVVDDEAPARSRIRQLLKGEPDFDLIAECSNGREAVECILARKPELAFLDVQMPRLSGLEVCEAIRSAAPAPLIVFVTAYDQHALKAFEFHAIDYLLKPFDRERFRRALTHVRDQLRRFGPRPPAQQIGALVEDPVRPETIDWIEADGNYVRLHTGESSHYVRGTLARLQDQLPAGKFMRISRSVLVNLDHVKELQPLFYGDYSVILLNGSRLNMSRNYRDRIESLLGNDPK